MDRLTRERALLTSAYKRKFTGTDWIIRYCPSSQPGPRWMEDVMCPGSLSVTILPNSRARQQLTLLIILKKLSGTLSELWSYPMQ